MEEGGGCDLKAQSGRVGSKVAGSAKFLKKLFTQTKPCRNILRNSKPSQMVQLAPSEPVAVVSTKRMRLESKEEWAEGSDRRKKRVICLDNSTVEAAKQSRQQP